MPLFNPLLLHHVAGAAALSSQVGFQATEALLADDDVAALPGTPISTDLHDPHPPRSIREAARHNGLAWVVSMTRQVLRARLQLRHTTLGKWVRVRGKVHVQNQGEIILGDRVRFRAEAAACELVTWPNARLEIGEATTINYGSSISAAGSVRIGKECLIGTYVNIMDCTFHNEDHTWNLDAAPVTIGDRVWLGNRCMIMKGVTIGDGAIVAACSLVTRDVPPNSMVVGVPARVVKNF